VDNFESMPLNCLSKFQKIKLCCIISSNKSTKIQFASICYSVPVLTLHQLPMTSLLFRLQCHSFIYSVSIYRFLTLYIRHDTECWSHSSVQSRYCPRPHGMWAECMSLLLWLSMPSIASVAHTSSWDLWWWWMTEWISVLLKKWAK
jgi:hypothetical protein